MPFTPRQQKILSVLEKQGHVSVQELAETFSVSTMTIHRDLNQMAAEGLVVKSHGAVSLPPPPSGENKCNMCGKALSERTLFIINLPSGEQRRACCAHCGLMMCQNTQGISLTADFLHNHMLSGSQATYLIQSDLTVCCAPGVLSFGSRQEAEKFQKGFGGKLVDMAGAIKFLHDGANAA